MPPRGCPFGLQSGHVSESNSPSSVGLACAWHGITLGALALAPAVTAWDLARGRGARAMRERLGAAPRAAGAAWFAAASAGEVAAGLPLLRLVASERVTPLVLSVGTRHGLRAAERHVGLLAAPVFHPPVDAAPCVACALSRLKPRALITLETEIWPNLFAAARARRIPIGIASGRLSPRAFPRYMGARPLVARALRAVRVIGARTPEDADRFLALGARPDSVTVTGNVKFDAALDAAAEPDLDWAAAAGLTEGPWVVAASTADGEEGAVLDAFQAAAARVPGLRLLLAPKRPDRWDAVATLTLARGLSLRRRSALAGASATPLPPGGVLLLDSTGELARAFRHARVAFVGGSLVPHGGQNLLEPAASGVPVLFGPHVDNFRDAEEALLSEGGGARVDATALADAMIGLLADRERHARAARGARAAVSRHAGAARRTLELLRPLLAERGGAPT